MTMKIPKIKSLKFQIIFITAILLSVLIVLFVMSLRRSFEVHKHSEEYALRNKINGHLNAAAGWQAIESGYGATIIGSGEGDSSPLYPKFLEMGKKGDAEVLQARKLTKELLSLNKGEMFEDILSSWTLSHLHLQNSRNRIAYKSISKDEWNGLATHNINSEFELCNTIFTPQKRKDEIIYFNTVLRPNIAKLCENAGLERALIGNAIASRRPISSESKNEIKRRHSIVENSIRQLLLLKHQPSTSNRMKQAIETFEKEFLQTFQILRGEVFLSSQRQEAEVSTENTQIVERKEGFQSFMHGTFADLSNLSKHKSIMTLARALQTEYDGHTLDLLGDVENLFSTFSQVKRIYDQIRFLDNTGHERVRVSFDDDTARIIKGTQLQDKSERYYFKEAINLQPWEIYISPLDLNVEHGKIEYPYKPVMRFATPVFIDEKQAGVVVLNLKADIPLFLHRKMEREEIEDYILVNKDGFYLHHPDKKKEWGMMNSLNRSHHNVRRDYPHIAEQILSGKEGKVYLPSGDIIIYKPLFPNSGSDSNRFWVFFKQIKGVDYPISASAWFDTATKAINSGLAISNVAGDEVNTIILEMGFAAKRKAVTNISVFAFSVLAFGFFIWWSRNRVLKPILQLTGVTQKIAEGDLSYRAEIMSGNEIGSLAANFNKMTSSLTDEITERKQNEENLRKLSQAVEQSPVTVVITNIEGDIEYVNKKFTQVTGYSYEEVIGQNPRILKSDDRTPEEYKDLWETIISGKEWRGEFCNKDKNGTIYWESASISPVKNDAGVITHFIAVKEDITERKRIEENLRKLSQAVEQSPVTVMITDIEGKIEYINSKFTELTGYTSEDALGHTPRILQSGKTPLEEYKKLWETIKSGNEWHGEFCNKKKNGILYWEHTSISPVNNEQGNTTHFVAVNEDVTERRQMEEMLKRSEKVAMVKMKEANESKRKAEVATNAKSEFLANMSHEIRTPMNGIMGMTDLLLDTKLTDEQRKFTATVRNSSNALLTIINDILDLSKIEAGKMELENIDFDLKIAVDGTIDILAIRAHEENLELSCFIDPEVPFLLHGDPGKLRQVIINLVNNAMKFTNDGEVAISANLEKETESHATVRFAVRDTGIGIPADRMDRLFKPFTQVDTSTTRKYGGTGLGLTICKQIVESMGGQIGVESKEGKGSTFWFTVVLGKQSTEQQPVELGVIENIRVLVVDDNDMNRHIFRKHLESWHCRVEEAVSAAEAIKELSDAVNVKDPFKIALLDYCMPEVDGESLCREIKADPQLKDLILVMLTSVGRRGDAEHFGKMGFAAYLTKPLKKSQLLDCLRLVTGESSSVGKYTAGQIVTQYSISEDHKQRVSILLAEDNMVNQKIALRLIEKKLGYHADAVANGKEVIEHLEKKDYDLVLMDCQMPEMDGYEATRVIRDESSSVRNHRIPIIAMTANAMKGDREKCIEAGMDDYITKPIKRQEFADVIERNLQNGRQFRNAPARAGSDGDCELSPEDDPEASHRSDSVGQNERDKSEIPALPAGRRNLKSEIHMPEIIYSEYADDADLVELIDEFAAGLEADVESMRKVLESGDHDGLRRLAHQMKGAGGSYGYPMLTEAAKAIEEAAKAEDVKAGTVALDKLEAFCRSVIRGRETNITISDC
ncbi:MAG: Sensor histidine kinase RcsC [Candidatus Scalindua arabica]|uniref:Sensory/regulatory protein RpfC n=1 Tax=Candidatus Scalindua arabica TaxID=1127984 RepID=A0A942A5U4_9BACT|nr:Sensor histidine kinase RcsC [Candidatus Scalindua arabica]